MGWFDKKSWQLRRKIRDLQTELTVAEREGKYVVAQGLFFAELQEMGDATLMVLGSADHLDPEEGAMIKTFFERNGFSVESLRLDKTQKNLATVEIIPPEELTRRVAKALKNTGFKLIDDSDKERSSNIDNRVITLSGLIRSISSLFASHVHGLIVSGPLKMNMEGNRLIHWLPLIRDELGSRVPAELLAQCRQPFVDAYNHYYGRFGKLEEIEIPESEEDTTDILASANNFDTFPSGSSSSFSSDTGSAPWSKTDTQETNANLSSRESAYGNEATAVATTGSDRALEAAHTLARMYKSLIGASDQRKPRNAEMLLEYVARLFQAKSACILARKTSGSPLTLIANFGGASCVQTDSEGAVSCASNTLEDCLSSQSVVIGKPSNGNSNPPAVAAPLLLESTLDAILYIVEPANFIKNDQAHLAQMAQVFREFPDLLISMPAEKNQGIL